MPCYRCCVASFLPVEELAALNCIHVMAESRGAESIAALSGAPTQDVDTPAALELLQADLEAVELSAHHRCRGSTALSILAGRRAETPEQALRCSRHKVSSWGRVSDPFSTKQSADG